MQQLTYIDLFAGAGGLSEGFIKNGFVPIAHLEMNENACTTIRTRIAYHYLKNNNNIHIYNEYLLGKITRQQLYSFIPQKILNSIINVKIENNTIPDIFESIDNFLGKNKIDIIIGGPPCQAYSLIGRARDPNKMRYDDRNFLFRLYSEFLKKYKPKYFVFENVKGLLSANNHFNQMLELFQSNEIGYTVSWKILNAFDYGVLQSRERVIIIGKRGNDNFQFPELKKIINKWSVKNDLFRDLPILKPGSNKPVMEYAGDITYYLKKFKLRNGSKTLTQHITRPHNSLDLKIYELAIKKWLGERKRLHYSELPKELKTHKNQISFLDRFKVIDPSSYSHTIVAHIAKDGHYYIYPDLKQIRSLSVREAARIQSFPDDYFFEGGRTSAFNQIGNAVPPLMAQELAKQLKKLFL